MALTTLDLPKMPTTALEINTAYAKRRREGGNDSDLEKAAMKLRKVLFSLT